MFVTQFYKKITSAVLLKNLAQAGKRYYSPRIRTYDEVRIPVPWGHVAGKWWGPQDKRPILAIHGWQDNSGSFDLLIPQLPPDIGFLAIDSPGHGLSSHISPGMYYHPIDSAITLRRIVRYFNWDNVSLLGHSMGAIVCYIYSVLYPQTIDFLICLDGLKPLVFDDNVFERISKNTDSLLKYEALTMQNTEPPCYSFEQMVEILHESSRKSIDLDKCKYILERNIAPSKNEPNKFYFTRDIRLKLRSLLDMAQKDIVDNGHRLTCPVLLFKTSKGPYVENKEYVMELLEVIKKTNKSFEMHMVEGKHHAHLNNPERMSGVINNFIEKYNLYDRSKGGLKPEIKVHARNYVDLPI